MSNSKNKSRNFSIYLLKKQFDDKNALKTGHTLGKPVSAGNLPTGSVLFVLDTKPKDPWWKSYWGITKSLKQTIKGAIAFVKVGGRSFALTFGHAYHYLKSESYEYDFGILTTLNAIDPEKIKSTDIFLPETARRERIQIPIAAELNFFDINADESVFRSLAGAVRDEYSDLMRHVSGVSSVRVSSKIEAKKIADLCSKLLEIYTKKDYKSTFPNIHNIQPVKDPTLIKKLDEKLSEEVKNQSAAVALTIPDISDPNVPTYLKYSGSGRTKNVHDEVNINDFYQYLEEKNKKIIDIDLLKKHKLNFQDDNGFPLKEFSIYNSLLYDCVINQLSYHLCDGLWYLIDKNYLNQLSTYLDKFFIQRTDLTECNDKREEDYNSNIAKNNVNFLCLDKTNIAPKNQTQIEPCDLYTVRNQRVNLIHIKISTRSSSLSHLFNQGVNSVEIVRLNDDSRNKLKSFIDNMGEEYIDSSAFTVTFGIITKKPYSDKSKALPLFSRISLKRALNALELMGVPSEVVLIKDNVER